MSEPGIEFLHVTYEVGGASSPEDAYQRHAGHEWGYVLTGSLQVRIGFEEFVLGPGDAISINSTIPHRLANIGDVPVTAIWFVLGRGQFDAQTLDRRAPHAAGRGSGPDQLTPPTAARGRPPRAARLTPTTLADMGRRRSSPTAAVVSPGLVSVRRS